MKNNLLNKATALVIGSLVIFSGQAVAFSSNNREFTDIDAMGKSEFLVAQDNKNIVVVVAIGAAVKALNHAVTVAQTVVKTIPVNIPPGFEDIVIPKLQAAVGSMAKAESEAKKGNNFEASQAVAQAITFMGEAQAVAEGNTDSTQVIAIAIAKANEALGLAQAQTKS